MALIRGVLNKSALTKNSVNLIVRSLSRNSNRIQNPTAKYAKYLLVIGGSVAAFTSAHLLKANLDVVQALNLKKLKHEDLRTVKLTTRERRFIKFASVEYDGQLYMTPQDFLDSVVEQEPRPRLKRRALSAQDIQRIKDETPPLKKGSVTMFRNLRDKGIISYTEYLFLLSVLTKPQSGFRIAFNMFDTDGNQRVDKDEFLVIRSILGGSLKKHEMDEETRRVLLKLVSTNEQAQQFKVSKPKVVEHQLSFNS